MFLCGSCNLDIGRKRSLLCTTCDQWFHVECESVTKELFAMLDKNRNLSYTCKECLERPPTDASNSNALRQEMRMEFASLQKTLRSLAVDIRKEQDELKLKIDTVVSEIGDIRAEFSNSVKLMRDEVDNCKKLIAANDDSTSKKFNELELLNHSLYFRSCRSEIVITGLSSSLINLNEAVIKMCNHFKVSINDNQITKAVYIKNKKSVLVKFSEITTRDKIMSEYFRFKSLTRSDIEGGTTTTRVFLNDNYSPLVNKLLRICWKLTKDKHINRYSIINREIPKAKIVMPDGDIKTLSLQELVVFFNLRE